MGCQHQVDVLEENTKMQGSPLLCPGSIQNWWSLVWSGLVSEDIACPLSYNKTATYEFRKVFYHLSNFGYFKQV